MSGRGERYSLGIDFGTESARAVLVEVESGQVVATAVHPYPHGVIDERLPLPEVEVPLPSDWALQHPHDWLEALTITVRAVLEESGISAANVVGLGVDFTACTVLPTTEDGTPLCVLEEFKRNPHAWPKLWKHHASQPQADRINTLAQERGEPWLARYGGKLSAEWLLPKALQILEEDPERYAAARYFVEGADWVTWRLTGRLVRNACAAGYKATWHKRDGFPSPGFLRALDPRLVDVFERKLAGPVRPPGERVGGLTPEWAERLGLLPETAVAVPIIDAHAAMLGSGVAEPGVLFLIMGTSTCHLLLSEREVWMKGIAGVVEDGIVPGYFGYEAGQAAVGDLLAWFVAHGVPPGYHQEARAKGISLHELLSERAEELGPGGSGLLALDWWNGNRSTLMDAELSGLLVGLTLGTRPEEIYRALIEATAFGTRVIVEAFVGGGLPVARDRCVVGGGLTKNPLLLQIYADIMGRELAVVREGELASARGAALLGAVAGGVFSTVKEAVESTAPPPAQIYRPVPEHQRVYEELYAEYRRLYDHFGREDKDVMRTLRRLRHEALQRKREGGQ